MASIAGIGGSRWFERFPAVSIPQSFCVSRNFSDSELANADFRKPKIVPDRPRPLPAQTVNLNFRRKCPMAIRAKLVVSPSAVLATASKASLEVRVNGPSFRRVRVGLSRANVVYFALCQPSWSLGDECAHPSGEKHLGAQRLASRSLHERTYQAISLCDALARGPPSRCAKRNASVRRTPSR